MTEISSEWSIVLGSQCQFVHFSLNLRDTLHSVVLKTGFVQNWLQILPLIIMLFFTFLFLKFKYHIMRQHTLQESWLGNDKAFKNIPASTELRHWVTSHISTRGWWSWDQYAQVSSKCRCWKAEVMRLFVHLLYTSLLNDKRTLIL